MHKLTRKFGMWSTLAVSVVALNVGVASAGPQGTNRPLKASGSATVTVDLSAGIDISIDGTLQATHLGKSTWQAEVVSFELGENVIVNYVSTITAANGDTVTTEATGVIDLTALTLTGIETITGGTGRFSDASGSFALSGEIGEVVDLGNGIITLSLTFSSVGTISY